jgi:hypothetical protein
MRFLGESWSWCVRTFTLKPNLLEEELDRAWEPGLLIRCGSGSYAAGKEMWELAYENRYIIPSEPHGFAERNRGRRGIPWTKHPE